MFSTLAIYFINQLSKHFKQLSILNSVSSIISTTIIKAIIIFILKEYILLSLFSSPCQCSVLPAYKEFNLILAWLVPDSGERERELSRRVIWERCLGSGCGPAIWRTSRWSMKRTVRPVKANFLPFSTMQNSKTNAIEELDELFGIWRDQRLSG